MRRSITLKLIALITAALVIFAASILIVIDRTNIDSAKNNAVKLLGAFETQMHDGGYDTSEEYDMLVQYTDTIRDLRISVISLEGKVISDTYSSTVGEMENHAERPEFLDALKGETSTAVRNSSTMKERCIYAAQLVEVNGVTVVLRIAVPIDSINGYLISVIIAAAIILAVLVTAAALMSGALTRSVLRPVELIKKKLLTVGVKNTDSPITITKDDELNAILQDIERLSIELDRAIITQNDEKEKLQLVIEGIDQGVIAVDGNLQAVTVNKTAFEFFNCKAALPAPVDNITRNQAVIAAIKETIESGEAHEDIIVKRSRIYRYRFIPVDSSDIKAIVMIWDVTDITKLHDEKREFFENASHELNTPLTSILGYSEMIMKENNANLPFAQIINKEALRMKALIADMLKISEFEENKGFKDEQIELKSLVESAVRSFRPKAEAKRIALITDLQECPLNANYEKITELVNNLLDNAIKYTDCGGRVELSLAQQEGKASLSVKDNGIGIPQKDQNRIFERFYRVDKGRSRAEGGTGLGLAIVKYICRHYNARLTLKSKEHIGTEITITFPPQTSI